MFIKSNSPILSSHKIVRKLITKILESLDNQAKFDWFQSIQYSTHCNFEASELFWHSQKLFKWTIKYYTPFTVLFSLSFDSEDAFLSVIAAFPNVGLFFIVKDWILTEFDVMSESVELCTWNEQITHLLGQGSENFVGILKIAIFWK